MLKSKSKIAATALKKEILYVLVCTNDGYIIGVFEQVELARHQIEGGRWQLLSDIWQNTRHESDSIYEIVPKEVTRATRYLPEQSTTFKQWCKEFAGRVTRLARNILGSG